MSFQTEARVSRLHLIDCEGRASSLGYQSGKYSKTSARSSSALKTLLMNYTCFIKIRHSIV